jgi:ribosomal protein L31E
MLSGQEEVDTIIHYSDLHITPTLCKANRAMNLMRMFLLTCSTAKAVALAH